MVRRVAGVDQRELLRLRVVERRLTSAAPQREPRGELVAWIGAPCWILVPADLRRHPHAALAVEHRVVRVRRVVVRVRSRAVALTSRARDALVLWSTPQMCVAPPQRRTIRLRETRRHLLARLAGRD